MHAICLHRPALIFMCSTTKLSPLPNIQNAPQQLTQQLVYVRQRRAESDVAKDVELTTLSFELHVEYDAWWHSFS
jgi:hypothetical protein